MAILLPQACCSARGEGAATALRRARTRHGHLDAGEFVHNEQAGAAAPAAVRTLEQLRLERRCDAGADIAHAQLDQRARPDGAERDRWRRGVTAMESRSGERCLIEEEREGVEMAGEASQRSRVLPSMPVAIGANRAYPDREG